jgi:hypothetical protein
MRYAIGILLMCVLLVDQSTHAAEVETDVDSSAAMPPATTIQTAPGGGDMVILGDESRYVTRARRDRSGQLRAGCERERGAREPSGGAERP